MRYAVTRYIEYQRDLAYRFYLTDELYYHGRNKTHEKRFSDGIFPTKVDVRSGDDIAAEVIKKAGLVVKK